MQHGDLQAWDQPSLAIVLEGVLADVIPVSKKIRFRRSEELPAEINWFEVPLKRLSYLKHTYPDTSIDVVTFTSEEVADRAAGFLFDHVPISSCRYFPFEDWVFGLKLRYDLHSIYDSNDERLLHFGQRGYKVIKGRDFG